jgi:hypothetical protein
VQENLASEIDLLFEKLTEDQIIDVDLFSEGSNLIKLLMKTKRFQNNLSMPRKLICLIVSQHCVEEQIKRVVLRQTRDDNLDWKNDG